MFPIQGIITRDRHRKWKYSVKRTIKFRFLLLLLLLLSPLLVRWGERSVSFLFFLAVYFLNYCFLIPSFLLRWVKWERTRRNWLCIPSPLLLLLQFKCSAFFFAPINHLSTDGIALFFCVCVFLTRQRGQWQTSLESLSSFWWLDDNHRNTSKKFPLYFLANDCRGISLFLSIFLLPRGEQKKRDEGLLSFSLLIGLQVKYTTPCWGWKKKKSPWRHRLPCQRLLLLAAWVRGPTVGRRGAKKKNIENSSWTKIQVDQFIHGTMDRRDPPYILSLYNFFYSCVELSLIFHRAKTQKHPEHW